MILDLWLVFIGTIFVIFLYLGFRFDSKLLRMIGWTLLFLISVVFLNIGIDYPNGLNQTIINASTTYTYDMYGNYQNHTVGYLMTITSAICFLFELFDNKIKEMIA